MNNEDAILKSVVGLKLDLFEHEKVQLASYEDKVKPEVIQVVAEFIEKDLPRVGGYGALFQSSLKDLINAETPHGIKLLSNEETLLVMDVENFIKRAAIAQGLVTNDSANMEPSESVPSPLADASNSEQPNKIGSTVRPADVFRPDQLRAAGSSFVPGAEPTFALQKDGSTLPYEESYVEGQNYPEIVKRPWYDKLNPKHKKQADEQAAAATKSK